MPNKDPTIFIVEDDPVVCQSLSWVLGSVNLNVETFSSALEYLKAFDTSRWGCLLIDIRLPGISGLELQEQLVQRKNAIPIIIITGHGDISMAIRAMKAGAKDFILKPFNNDLLLERIQNVIMESKKQQMTHQAFAQRLIHLTPREHQVMELVIDGKSNKVIAAELGISISTIEQHRAHLMQKMQVKSLAELIKAYLVMENL